MSQIGKGPDPGGIPVEARKKALTHSNNSADVSLPCAADTGPLFDAPKAAESARAAYFRRLALRSAIIRAARRTAAGGADAA